MVQGRERLLPFLGNLKAIWGNDGCLFIWHLRHLQLGGPFENNTWANDLHSHSVCWYQMAEAEEPKMSRSKIMWGTLNSLKHLERFRVPAEHKRMKQRDLMYSSLYDSTSIVLHGQRSLGGHRPWGWKESATTERLTLILLSFVSLFFLFFLFFPFSVLFCFLAVKYFPCLDFLLIATLASFYYRMETYLWLDYEVSDKIKDLGS